MESHSQLLAEESALGEAIDSYLNEVDAFNEEVDLHLESGIHDPLQLKYFKDKIQEYKLRSSSLKNQIRALKERLARSLTVINLIRALSQEELETEVGSCYSSGSEEEDC
jgi:hypothetical protein